MNESTRRIVESVADCIPAHAFRLESSGGRDRLWLPKPAAADYAFYLETDSAGGVASIGALRNGGPEDEMFWHLPIDYREEDEQKASAVLAEELKRLIRHPSRIVRSAGFLLWRFQCEVEEGGAWKRVGGTIACPRLPFLPPLAFRFGRTLYRSEAPGSAV